ncbi:hypothetical protein GE061_009740 [Apolygus lucorum]|uniref:Uncharacterized protein n=1 Tax=Apolygus lucorum TaxID=248454 RepID=A0A6A4K5S3_APOLU|nr:hypothetical protein GE061_009740 [Apolygus lucorum]
MDDEDSQLLVDDSTFENIFVKCEPNSPITDFESTENVQTFSIHPPAKVLKIQDTYDKNEPICEPSGISGGKEDFLFAKKKKKKHVPLDPFEKEIMNILERNRSKVDYAVHDPDTMFFISHVPVIKRFSPKEKLDFQRGNLCLVWKNVLRCNVVAINLTIFTSSPFEGKLVLGELFLSPNITNSTALRSGFTCCDRNFEIISFSKLNKKTMI